MPARIAIIGGGWAGLSCAVRLAQKQNSTQPLQIAVFEAAPQFGGRARGLDWQGHAVDNGQHLAIGAYTQTWALLETVQAPAWKREPLRWAGVARDAQLAQDWQVPDKPWPARVLRASLPGSGPRGWPVQWKWAMAMQLAELSAARWCLAREPALQWLERKHTPRDLIAHFWQPLIEGALNTPIAQACMQTVARILKDSLAGPQGASSVLQPERNLSIDGVDPICNWLSSQGVQLHKSHRALALRPHDSGEIAVTAQAGTQSVANRYDAVVVALPYLATLSLWQESLLPKTPAIQRLEALRSCAITTVWVELTETGRAQLARLPSWFVLNPIANTPAIAQVAVTRGTVLALVISAQHTQQDRVCKQSHGQALAEQIKAQLAIDIAGLPQKWITEKHATWACTPESPIASESDSHGLTQVRNVFRCADDLEPGYPATIESAVRSGARCARSVIQALGL